MFCFNRKNKLNLECNSWSDYWSIFDKLISKLKENNLEQVIVELEDAQLYVNGLTDGWFEFKTRLKTILKNNKKHLNDEQIQILKFLIKKLKIR